MEFGAKRSSGPYVDVGDPDTRTHASLHTDDNTINVGDRTNDPRGHPDRKGGGTHGDADPGTVDSNFHSAPTECLGSSQSNRRCGETTQTKFK